MKKNYNLNILNRSLLNRIRLGRVLLVDLASPHLLRIEEAFRKD